MELSEVMKLRLGQLAAGLGEGIIGQESAISSVVSVALRAECGLKEPGRPKGSFLFMGPTGVGKTQMPKDLTRLLYDSEDAIAIFDMSEFQRPSSIQQLLGTRRSKGRLHSLIGSGVRTVVLDEVEKAYKPLLNLLLQVLDGGRLTLGDGEVVDFQDRYLFLTSNLESEAILKAQSGLPSALRRFVEAQAMAFFTPELFGRIEVVEVFQPLSFAQRVEIGRLIAAREVERLRALGEPAEEVVGNTLLAMCAKDCDLGARPLRKKIQAIIQDALIIRKMATWAA